MNDPVKDEFHRARRHERRARRLAEYQRGLRPFAIAAYNVSKEHNFGSLVRTAHAAAASELLLVGDRDWNIEAARTADAFTEIRILADAAALLAHIAQRGYRLVAIELADGSVNIFEARYPDHPCFLLGAEIGGIPNGLLDAAEQIVQIPQWGLVPCLNLAVAGSIVIYDYLSKLHAKGRLDRPRGGLVTTSEGSTAR